MDEVSVFKKEIHLSGIDEFLADALLEGKGKPVRLAIRKKGDQGYVSVLLLMFEGDVEEDGIDFELSSCECGGLEGMEVSDFLRRPVFTSSAYGFFDFLLVYLDSIECLVGFSGSAWKVKVLKQEAVRVRNGISPLC